MERPTSTSMNVHVYKGAVVSVDFKTGEHEYRREVTNPPRVQDPDGH